MQVVTELAKANFEHFFGQSGSLPTSLWQTKFNFVKKIGPYQLKKCRKKVQGVFLKSVGWMIHERRKNVVRHI